MAEEYGVTNGSGGPCLDDGSRISRLMDCLRAPLLRFEADFVGRFNSRKVCSGEGEVDARFSRSSRRLFIFLPRINESMRQ